MYREELYMLRNTEAFAVGKCYRPRVAARQSHVVQNGASCTTMCVANDHVLLSLLMIPI